MDMLLLVNMHGLRLAKFKKILTVKKSVFLHHVSWNGSNEKSSITYTNYVLVFEHTLYW